MTTRCSSGSSSQQQQQQQQQQERHERGDWRRFQAEVMQCWVGEAVVQVAERAVVSGSVESVAFCGLLANGRDADAFANLRAFVGHFERRRHLRWAGMQGSDGEGRDISAGVSSIPSIVVGDTPEFKTWLASHNKQLLALGRHSALIILYAPLLQARVQQEIVEISTQSGAAEAGNGSLQTLLLVIRDPIGLMDVDNSLSIEPSSGYQLIGPRELLDAAHTTLTYPLQQLASQCGLRFVMEIARWTVFKEELQIATERTVPPDMLASVAHMPFQLLLQLLRWSHFHPTLVRALAKPFGRKLRLIPQARIRDAIICLCDQEMAIWAHIDASYDMPSLGTVLDVRRHSECDPTQGVQIPACDVGLEDKQSLSDCQLWNVQKQFYLSQGIHAWSDGIIPFGVSSSSFLAATYARVVFEFFLETGAERTCDWQHQTPENEPNCFIWEAASGSCKFLYAFLVHFYQLVDANIRLFVDRGMRFCVIGSDLSDQVLDSRMEMPCFQPYLSDRRLDFARFDSTEFIEGDCKRQLRLKRSDRIWHVGRDGPVFLMGNYFLDSLRADVFVVTSATEDALLQVSRPQRPRSKVYQGRINPDITSIADMKLSFQPVNPTSKAVYTDPFINQVLLDILESIDDSASAATSSSLILFPVEAIQMLRTLTTPDSDAFNRKHAVGILFGDASFSFRDAISSAFFGQEDGANVFEIPQLSPHPDCFCLPVDFEILRIFLRRLGLSFVSATSTQVASAISTDTFDVLHATVYPLLGELDHGAAVSPERASQRVAMPLSQVGFAHEFASFTPSDCDLLWGMMGVDKGAAHFSLKTLVALLAQSAWDFDLFVILQWKLMSIWRAQAPNEALRTRLISIANRCWATYYALENEAVSRSLTLLQHSRWLYQLGAHRDVVVVLTEKLKTHPNLASNPNICYVIGLAFYSLGDLWRALASFRKCVAVDPGRMKFKRRVTETLLALQSQKHAERAS